MSQPIVIQLQELASNSEQDINDLLRKSLMVATKLGLSEFRNWIMAELNGYSGTARETLPDYRVIRGQLQVQNPFHGLQPFLVPQQLHDTITVVNVTESVSSIHQLLTDSVPGHIVFFFTPEQEQILMSIQESFAPLRPVRVVGPNKLLAILNTVRTRILEWALSLESEGILGDGLSFSASEKKTAMQSQNIRIENFQGILGNVQDSSVTQTNTQTITPSDFSSLAHYLATQGLNNEQVRELEVAIQEDPEPRSNKGFGPRVSAWMGKMLTLAASGSWEVGVSTAGTLLSNALSKFYGLG